MLKLEKFSLGVGDRFAHQAHAQLRACEWIAKDGFEVIPVWNKSNREHSFIGSEPHSVLDAAKRAISDAKWTKGWHVDADHIRLETVDRFLAPSDFFTIDVADSIGKEASSNDVDAFVARHPELIGKVSLARIDTPFTISESDVRAVAKQYLSATQEAGAIYRYIASKKGEENFIAEVSMDETDSPQTPPELLIILAALADQKIRLQTIAPKFTGRFNKGVDYVGDLPKFAKEFHDDLAVVDFAVKTYGLPDNLKLSVHSGSDKFSLYPIIRQTLPVFGAGLHVKTAGTTWLEELIGLAEAGGDGLAFSKLIYSEAVDHVDELRGPYASVIDIDSSKLPAADKVQNWTSEQFVRALRHVPSDPQFNGSFRQLLHVSFKLAAQKGNRYLDLLNENSEIVGKNVTDNLYSRHLRPLFVG
jgi:hypothetical protein